MAIPIFTALSINFRARARSLARDLLRSPPAAHKTTPRALAVEALTPTNAHHQRTHTHQNQPPPKPSYTDWHRDLQHYTTVITTSATRTSNNMGGHRGHAPDKPSFLANALQAYEEALNGPISKPQELQAQEQHHRRLTDYTKSLEDAFEKKQAKWAADVKEQQALMGKAERAIDLLEQHLKESELKFQTSMDLNKSAQGGCTFTGNQPQVFESSKGRPVRSFNLREAREVQGLPVQSGDGGADKDIRSSGLADKNLHPCASTPTTATGVSNTNFQHLEPSNNPSSSSKRVHKPVYHSQPFGVPYRPGHLPKQSVDEKTAAQDSHTRDAPDSVKSATAGNAIDKKAASALAKTIGKNVPCTTTYVTDSGEVKTTMPFFRSPFSNSTPGQLVGELANRGDASVETLPSIHKHAFQGATAAGTPRPHGAKISLCAKNKKLDALLSSPSPLNDSKGDTSANVSREHDHEKFFNPFTTAALPHWAELYSKKAPSADFLYGPAQAHERVRVDDIANGTARSSSHANKSTPNSGKITPSAIPQPSSVKKPETISGKSPVIKLVKTPSESVPSPTGSVKPVALGPGLFSNDLDTFAIPNRPEPNVSGRKVSDLKPEQTKVTLKKSTASKVRIHSELADCQSHPGSGAHSTNTKKTKAAVNATAQTTQPKKVATNLVVGVHRKPDATEEGFDVVGKDELERDDDFDHVEAQISSGDNGKGDLSFWGDEEDEEEWLEGWDEGGLAKQKAKVGIGARKGKEVKFKSGL
ncbi:hypothetical protein Q7P37_008577 [Cladosporium fusiforme]